MKRKMTRREEIENEESYIQFLIKRLQSANYKANVTKEEYEKTEAKYDKAKFKLRLMKMQKK